MTYSNERTNKKLSVLDEIRAAEKEAAALREAEIKKAKDNAEAIEVAAHKKADGIRAEARASAAEIIKAGSEKAARITEDLGKESAGAASALKAAGCERLDLAISTVYERALGI